MDRYSLFPPEVRWVFSEAKGGEEAVWIEQLTSEERQLLKANAAPRRLAEFGMGRACGREALRLLGAWAPGASPPSILRRDRTPLWPGGIVGSIAHSHGAAVAAAAYGKGVRALGVDLERSDRDVTAVQRRALRPEERETLTGKPAALGLLVFCVKESIFKALHPLTGVYLGFQDASVHLPANPPELRGEASGTVEWELLRPCREEYPAGYRGTAGWVTISGRAAGTWLVTGVWIAM